MVATYVLPPILRQLRQRAPGVVVEVISSNRISDLTRREAGIAIRHLRPEQPDLIARLVRDTSGHLYASPEYLNHFGRPKGPSDLAHADFVGFENPDMLMPVLRELGLSLSTRNFRLITSSGVAMFQMVRAGLGIGVMPAAFAAFAPKLECVLPDLMPIPTPIPTPTWLTTHRELHTSARIRLVFDLLADNLSRQPGGAATGGRR